MAGLLLERHQRSGARVAERPEAPGLQAPLTFGDVPAEYAAARESCALLDETDRGRLLVRGGDAAPFLHRILAGDVRGLAPGAGNANLLLSPKGKVLFPFDLACEEEGLALTSPPGAAEPLREALDVYLFGEDVSFELVTEGCAPLELVGPEAPAVLAAALGPLPELDDHATASLDGVRVTPLRVAGAPGWRVDGGRARAAALWDALVSAGARPAGLVARDSLRVEACTALYGVDVDENVYPQEARLEDAFSLEKGCYVGQEVVAKIDTYGGQNKLLMTLSVDHDDPVPRGTPLFAPEDAEHRQLGMVTSWAYSFLRDGGLVLGYVKRRHQQEGTTFLLGENGGRATIVPPPAWGG